MLLHLRLITLHDVRGKILKLSTQSHYKMHTNKAVLKNVNQAEIAESEGIKAIVSQVAIQAATAVMMMLRDTDVGPQAAINTTASESHRNRNKVDQP